MLSRASYDFAAVVPEKDFALICPANPDDMKAFPKLFREKGLRYIYDPSQQLPMHSGEELLDCIRGAYLLVGNDYEIQLIMNNTGRTKEELVNLTTRGVIVTLGEQGSVVIEKGAPEEKRIPAVPVGNVVDPTGAGDAYRAGLLKGLLLDQSLAECARLGSTCAAYCIEKQGTQGHDFNLDDFFRRHAAAFGNPV